MRYRLLSLAAAAAAAGVMLAGCEAGPRITVTPNTDLVDSQVVTVVGSGYSPNAPVGTIQCVAGAESIDRCDSRTARSFSTDSTGGYEQQMTVRRVIRHYGGTGGTEIDCTVPDSCIVASVYLHGFQGLATAPLHFAP